MQTEFEIGPEQLTLDDIQVLVNNPSLKLRLSPVVLKSIFICREFLDQKMEANDSPIYGINTGFGSLCDTKIEAKDLEKLQENLIRSHACGLGDPIPEEVVRLMLFLKAKSISFGHSGVAPETSRRLLDFYNSGMVPVVYEQGSLGASGDLAPLAHLCLPLIGEGEVRRKGEVISGKEALASQGWDALRLKSKEGLGLLNGTQFMLSYALHSILKARRYSRWADYLCALSVDGFNGRTSPFSPELHAIRPHPGQIETAARIKTLLADSEIAHGKKDAVQDPYSFRCSPQVHGASKDAIRYCETTFSIELNSTTDNPNIFVDSGKIISGGNFHGQPLAMALDFLAMALAELGSISERRVFQLLSGERGLPPFLVAIPGLNSGLMIAQYSAASLVSQNKQLCTPAVVDTIPSSNGQEDHVSMGANGATKCYKVVKNLRNLLAIELLTASQALWFRKGQKTGSELQEILKAFRKVVPPVEEDRILYGDIARAAQFIDEWEFQD